MFLCNGELLLATNRNFHILPRGLRTNSNFGHFRPLPFFVYSQYGAGLDLAQYEAPAIPFSFSSSFSSVSLGEKWDDCSSNEVFPLHYGP